MSVGVRNEEVKSFGGAEVESSFSELPHHFSEQRDGNYSCVVSSRDS